jgi:hypothetical protein
MAQVTEAQLFEMLGRLFAELRAVTAENAQLRMAVGAKEPEKTPDKSKKPKEE